MAPRPRPRPRLATKSSSSVTPVSPVKPRGSPEITVIDDSLAASPTKCAANAPRGSPISQKVAEEEDDFFDRSNRRKLQALSKRAAKTPEPLDDALTESSPSTGQKRKRGAGSSRAELNLPKWTQGKRVASDTVQKTPVLSVSSGSDSDQSDDIVVVGGSSPRAPSRNMTITPPPIMSREERERLRQQTKKAFSVPRPFDEEEEDATIIETVADLDPDLAAIKERARQRSETRRDIRQRLSQEPESILPPRSTPQVVGPEKVELIVRIYPPDWETEDDDQRVQPLKFKIKRTDPFRRCFGWIADRVDWPLTDLIVTYEHKQVWGSATPHSLKIWSDATLDAYTRGVHDRVESARRLRQASVEPLSQAPESQASEAEAEQVEDRLHVTLLGAGMDKAIRILVRRTTPISKLLNGFLKKSGREGQRAALVFDGDDLDPHTTVGDYDLEEGDQLEVKIL